VIGRVRRRGKPENFRSQPIQLFLIYFTAEIDAAFRIWPIIRIPKGLFGHPFFLRTGMDCSTATSGLGSGSSGRLSKNSKVLP